MGVIIGLEDNWFKPIDHNEADNQYELCFVVLSL